MSVSIVIAFAAMLVALLPQATTVLGSQPWMALPLTLLGVGAGFLDGNEAGRSLNLLAAITTLGVLAHQQNLI